VTKTLELGDTGAASLVLRNTGAGDTAFSLLAYDQGRQIAVTGQQPFDAGVPWLTASPVSGTLAAGAETPIALAFDASIPAADQPGDYYANLEIVSTQPDNPAPVAVTMHVLAPADWGKLTGTVRTQGACDVDPAPLADATVTISGPGGFSHSVQTDAAGDYVLWAAPGSGPFTITATKSEHQTAQVENIVLPADGSVQTDLDLRWARACLAADPAALALTLQAGKQGEQTLRLTNGGGSAGRFTVREHGMTAAGALASTNANPPFADVIQSWSPAQNPAPWGIAYTPEDTVWVGEGWGANHLDGYLPDGTYVGPSPAYAWSPGAGPADFTYNANTGKLWVMDVEGDSCLHEVDPEAGATGATICPSWAGGRSQRGLAFDPTSNTYFAGEDYTWDTNRVYHFDESGSILDSALVARNVAGLAYNPDTQHLFVLEDTWPIGIAVLDAANSYAEVKHTTLSSFAGSGGLEIGCDGSLWAVDQSQNLVHQLGSGESTSWCGAEIAWLSLSPASGAIPVGGEAAISVRYDATGLLPGDYSGEIAVFHNTPGNRMTTIAVTLHVAEEPTPTTELKLYLPNIMR
jgi:DNA-binding beta-propeller fold protein YncE